MNLVFEYTIKRSLYCSVKPFPQPGGAYGAPGSQPTQQAHAAAASAGGGEENFVYN